ncbi:MAG: LegC family aminotransferase [Cyanobacteria bacterium TGS_CYA1]|nr:LegC family aminotransferase [Cyanobacteria bacterium TGS_CYA1]
MLIGQETLVLSKSTSKSPSELVKLVCEKIRLSCKLETGELPLHEPSFESNEWKYVKDCIDSGWVSSVGKYVNAFEDKLCEVTGSKRAIAVSNGTSALHMAFRLAGVLPGDEVLVPSITFVATANAISYTQAIPHFVDSSKTSLGVCPIKLKLWLEKSTKRKKDSLINAETGRRIAALVVVHVLGHSADLDAISEICKEYQIKLIEDAAEALGTYYKGRHVGNDGLISCLSFNGNKTVTTGGGGAILTNDDTIGDIAKHITTTAKVPHAWHFFHDQLGFNYRMPNLNAALGLAQLEILPEYLNRKSQLAQNYEKAFFEVDGVQFFMPPSNTKSNNWLNALMLQDGLLEPLLDYSHKHKIFTRPLWTPMHELPMYSLCPKQNLENAQWLFRNLITLPSGPKLGRASVQNG